MGSKPSRTSFFDITPPAELIEEAPAEVLDFQKTGTLRDALVDPKRAHHAQRCSTLKRADEARVAVKETGLPRPGFHLASVQEKTARMRVLCSLKRDRRSEQLTGRDRLFFNVLKRSGHVGAK